MNDNYYHFMYGKLSKTISQMECGLYMLAWLELAARIENPAR